jgi:hypothetical protein
LSLVASSVREWIESMMKTRSVDLERGVRALLDDSDGKGLTAAIYGHPMVYGLYQGAYEWVQDRKRGGNLPSYIPTQNFVAALLDITARGSTLTPYTLMRSGSPLTLDEIRSGIARVPSERLQRALTTAMDHANGDLDQMRKNLGAWFDSSMDRVSGWYKRRTQLYLFAIGLGTTLILNVNTIRIGRHLYQSDAARELLVQRAETLRQDTTYRRMLTDTTAARVGVRERYEGLAALEIPIGWDHVEPPPGGWKNFPWFFAQAIGLLLTAFAITFGAPFWFDLLNKIMVIRSTVKPNEKSPPEASEDRQKSREKVKVEVNPVVDARSTAAAALATAPGTALTAGAAGGAPVIDIPEPPHTPHEWETGDPDEGII